MTHSSVKFIALSLLLVAIGVGGLLYFDVQDYILQLFEWLDGLGIWGPIFFMLIVMMIVVMMLPGVLFTLGAGFLFGPLLGSLYIVIATTTGALIAFILARYFFSATVSRFLHAHERLRVLNDEFSQEGWKFILLTRMIPFFPFKPANYFFGVTDFTLRDFLIGTFFGIMPITFFNVYLGSLAADLTMLGARDSPRSGLEWGLYGLGFLIMVVALVYITQHARKALDRYAASH